MRVVVGGATGNIGSSLVRALLDEPGVDHVVGVARRLPRHEQPGVRLACLEITRPEGLLKPFFRLWFDGLVPLAGKVLPGGRAYTYLPASVRRFPGPSDLAAAFGRAGFDGVGWKLMGGGIVALHVGTKR